MDESTVCLMGLERRLTLSLIEEMAYQIYPEPYSTVAADDPNLLSPMSVCSDASSTISTASSAPSSGYATPQKPDTPTPAPLSHHVVQQHQQQHQQQPTFSASVCTCCTMIPTYEIVTSCQPAVVYSNGYYYTSFLGGGGQAGGDPATVKKLGSVPASTAFCLACSCCGCGAAAANAQRSVQTACS